MITALFIGLLAPPPEPCPTVEAHQFDFWIGEWNIVNRYRTEERGWVIAGTATNHVFAVAGGCAIVELWDGHLGDNPLRGFSVRTWDPARGAWVLVLNWPQPNGARFGTLEGTFHHGRGEFVSERATDDGGLRLTRYTFTDITDSTFRWHNGVSLDSGRTWTTPTWIMEFTRRPAGAPPLFNLATADPARTRLCTREADRAFDDLLGTWSSADGTARRRSYAVIGGCATMDFLTWSDADGGTNEAFFVRAFTGEEWEQWHVSTLTPGAVRLVGTEARLASEDGSETVEWVRDGPDAITLRWRRGGEVLALGMVRVP